MAAGEFCIGGEAPSFNSYGDEYDKKMAIDPKYKGRQFLVNNKAEFWDKDRAYLSQGDRYEDPGTLEKAAKREQRKKLPDRPWKGTTGFLSTFGDTLPHETEYVTERRGEPRKPYQPDGHPLRNIVTGRSPRRGPGQLGKTLGGNQEVEYISDPYDRAKEMEREQRKAAQKEGKAWSISRAPGMFGDGKTYAPTAVFKRKEPKPPAPNSMAKMPAWRPSGGRRPPLPTIEYREDPYDWKERSLKPKPTKIEGPVWKPVNAGKKTVPFRSIMPAPPQ
jgi:hypothetical protein